MSKTSTHDAALSALLGTGSATPHRDEEAEAVAGVLGTIRGQLLAAAKQEGVGIREMARRLGVSGAAVSRQLGSDRDLRVATAVLLARALHRRWSVTLQNDSQSSQPTKVTVLPPAVPPARRRKKPA